MDGDVPVETGSGADAALAAADVVNTEPAGKPRISRKAKIGAAAGIGSAAIAAAVLYMTRARKAAPRSSAPDDAATD